MDSSIPSASTSGPSLDPASVSGTSSGLITRATARAKLVKVQQVVVPSSSLPPATAHLSPIQQSPPVVNPPLVNKDKQDTLQPISPETRTILDDEIQKWSEFPPISIEHPLGTSCGTKRKPINHVSPPTLDAPLAPSSLLPSTAPTSSPTMQPTQTKRHKGKAPACNQPTLALEDVDHLLLDVNRTPVSSHLPQEAIALPSPRHIHSPPLPPSSPSPLHHHRNSNDNANQFFMT